MGAAGPVHAKLQENKSSYAIVYSFVPKAEELELSAVQERLDFFHLAGFNLIPYKEDNWHGKGILVDLSNILPPHCYF